LLDTRQWRKIFPPCYQLPANFPNLIQISLPIPPAIFADAEARRNRFERIRKVRKTNGPPRMTLANRGQAENKRDESPRLASSHLVSPRLISSHLVSSRLVSHSQPNSTRRDCNNEQHEVSSPLFSLSPLRFFLP